MFKREVVLVLIIGFLSGCAASKQARDVTTSGFLGDYSKLVKGEEGQELYRYNNPKANWAAYKQILLDPVMIWKDPQAPQKTPDEDLQRLADFFYTALWEELKKDYVMVSKPDREAMRVQVAIVNVQKTNPALATVSSVAHPFNPFFLGSLGKNMITGKPFGAGDTAIEGKVTDSLSGDLLGAAVDRRVGGGKEKLSSWVQVEDALTYWAKNSRYRFCQARGGKDCEKPK
jgi:hypothetical protein